MDILKARERIKKEGLTVKSLPLRVTFYARVSTDTDEQLNSLDNQIAYYRNYIEENPGWSYVDGYIDEGITGVMVKKRESFIRMIADAKAGKFDLIIAKEVSRFARNLLDSVALTRELLNDGVAVFFQNDGINTIDEDSEFRLAIMASIAQDESRKLSLRVKFGHRMAIKNGVVLGNSRIYGYDKKDKKLVINPTEAEMVRTIFELYATDNYSMKDISNIIYDRGYRNHNGKKLSHSTMRGMIANMKYMGYYVGNKVRITDYLTKKQEFLPEEEWVVYKDETGETVPAIVSEELWHKANEVLKRRSVDVKERQNICNHSNLLTGKLVCSHCGRTYYRRDSKDKKGNDNSKWLCSGKVDNGAHTCPSLAIYESEIKPILYDVFMATSDNSEKLVESYIEAYKSLSRGDDTEKEIEYLNGLVEKETLRRSKLLDYNIEGKMDDDTFLAMSQRCTDNINKYIAEIALKKNIISEQKNICRDIEKIHKGLLQAKKEASAGLIDKSFVNRYIDKIYVSVENNEITMDIAVMTGERHCVSFNKSECRSGQMFKKMIMNAENAMKTNSNG